ncbi:hypothetical protein MHY86_08660 [Aerococcus urinaeequi]|uniref:hypothetical protein n=1 Tax=Aerococcus urinaeequi TaxID=51665 RepID=UPI00228068E2|nr:hypothetical protein [Aerococcus urinaeequi]MCY7731769.1 hypothetical protein [Aerococcus urinaeequi]
MGLNTQKTAYIISRTKDGIEEVAQYNDYNNTIYWYESQNSASEFDTLEFAKGMLQIQQMMATLTKQDYDFKLYQLDSETFEINEEGVRVEVEEEPTLEPTPEPEEA